MIHVWHFKDVFFILDKHSFVVLHKDNRAIGMWTVIGDYCQRLNSQVHRVRDNKTRWNNGSRICLMCCNVMFTILYSLSLFIVYLCGLIQWQFWFCWDFTVVLTSIFWLWKHYFVRKQSFCLLTCVKNILIQILLNFILRTQNWYLDEFVSILSLLG